MEYLIIKKETHFQKELDNYTCGKRKDKTILPTSESVLLWGMGWGEGVSCISIFQWYAGKGLTTGSLERKKKSI